MLGMLHKTNTIIGASHLGAQPFMQLTAVNKAVSSRPKADHSQQSEVPYEIATDTCL